MAGERKNNVIPEAFWWVVGHSSKEGTIQKLQSSETDQGKLDEFVSKPPELEVMASPLVSEVKSVHDGDSSPEPRPKVKTLEEILADKVNAHLTLYDSSLFLKDQMGGEIQSKILDAFLEYYEPGNKGYVYRLRKAELVSHTPLDPEELIAQFFPFQEAQRQQWLLATAEDAFLKKQILPDFSSEIIKNPQDSPFKIFSKHQNLQKQKDDAQRYNIREVEDEEETSLEEKRHSDDSLAVRGGGGSCSSSIEKVDIFRQQRDTGAFVLGGVGGLVFYGAVAYGLSWGVDSVFRTHSVESAHRFFEQHQLGVEVTGAVLAAVTILAVIATIHAQKKVSEAHTESFNLSVGIS